MSGELTKVIIFAVVAYFAAAMLMFIFQRKIMYLPSKDMKEPSFYGLNGFEEHKIKTKDNVTLTSWFKPGTKGTIVYFHGNAGNVADRQDKLKTFTDDGYAVMAVSYRGYGTSEGHPTELGLYEDARASIKFLNDKGMKTEDMIAFGESLGSGIAVQMATEHNFKLVALEAPYTAVARRAAELYPWLPVKLLIHDKYESIKKIRSVKSPLLIMHGLQDNVIPIAHGLELYQAANEPKKFVEFKDVNHVSFNARELLQNLEDFSKK